MKIERGAVMTDHATGEGVERLGWGFQLRYVVQWNRNLTNNHLRVYLVVGPHFEFVGEDAARLEAVLRAPFAESSPPPPA